MNFLSYSLHLNVSSTFILTILRANGRNYLWSIGLGLCSLLGKSNRMVSHLTTLPNSCGLLHEDPWRRKWQPTPVFLPRESHGQKSLAGYSPRGRKSQTQLSD